MDTIILYILIGQPKYQKDFGPLVPGFEYVPYNDLKALKAKVSEINGRGGGQKVAGIMMETLQGEGGIRPGEQEFFTGIRQICDETGMCILCSIQQSFLLSLSVTFIEQNLISSQFCMIVHHVTVLPYVLSDCMT